MSRAFTKETDDAPEQPSISRSLPTVPPGVTNYMTAKGAQRLRDELDRLLNLERPRLAATPDDAESKLQLPQLDQRIRHLQQSLHSAVTVPASTGSADQVRFGTTVTIRDSEGESHYRIVGVDEADGNHDLISFLSPIAKALLNRKIGEKIHLKGPAGGTELEIVGIVYE